MKSRRKSRSHLTVSAEPLENATPEHDGIRRSIHIADKLIISLFVAALLHAFYCWSVGWDQPIVDAHEFRQTQTAITCYYMRSEGLSIAYETPVLGPPWKIPFEFPFYQWAVVLLSKAGIALESAGRAISILSFLVAVFGFYVGSAVIFDHWRHRLIAVVVLLTNPFLLFWSRSFMIETTAVAFGVWAVVLSYLFGKSGRFAFGGIAVILACATALQKITTFPVFYVLIVAITADAWRMRRLTAIRACIFLSLCTMLPIALTKCWVDFADAMKSQNYFGRALTSAALAEWNYGTLAERLQLRWLDAILGRLSYAIYHPAAGVVIAFAFLVGVRNHWRTHLILAASFLAPLLAFTPLYGHSYYLCANLSVLCLMFALVISDLVRREGLLRYAGLALGTLLIGIGIYRSHTLYLPLQRHPDTERVWAAKAIQLLTPEDRILVGLGTGWSSVIPYYSERRSLLLPLHPSADDIEAAKDLLTGQNVGGLVLHIRMDEEASESARLMNESKLLAQSLGLSDQPVLLRSEWYLLPCKKTQEWYDELNVAKEAFLGGDASIALKILSGLPPTFNDGLFMAASIHFQIGQPEAAISALEQMIRNMPGDPVTYAAVGDHLFKYAQADRRYTSQAMAYLDQAITLEPYQGLLYVLRSRMKQFSGDSSGANRDLQYADEIPLQWRLDQNGDLARQADYL